MPAEFLKILFDRGQLTENRNLYDDRNQQYHRHYYLGIFEFLWLFNKTIIECTVSFPPLVTCSGALYIHSGLPTLEIRGFEGDVNKTVI